MRFFIFGFLLLLSSKLNLVYAQEEGDQAEEEPEEQETHARPPRAFRTTSELMNKTLQSSSGIHTSFKLIYPKNATGAQPGDIVTVLIGFENIGTLSYRVTDICASLAPSVEPENIIRNFTAFHHNITINPHTIHTLVYQFQIDDKTNPFEYNLIVGVFYYDLSKFDEFASIPYNSTFTVIEASGHLSARTFLVLFSLFIGAIVLAIYNRRQIKEYCQAIYKSILKGELDFRRLRSSKKTAEKKKKPINTGNPEKDQELTQARDDQDEWLSNTDSYRYIKKARARRAVSKSPMRASEEKPRGRSPTTNR